jgi:hypothetical protein
VRLKKKYTRTGKMVDRVSGVQVWFVATRAFRGSSGVQLYLAWTRGLAREMSVGVVHLLGLRLCVCLVCVPAPPVFLNR